MRITIAAIATLALFSACGDEPASSLPTTPGSGTRSAAARTSLAVDATWTWQLLGSPPPPYTDDVYDVDLFDTSDETIDAIHDAGRLVICYLSAGSSEDWRPDDDLFASDDRGGDLDGWPGERWLDVRSPTVRAVMTARLDLAASRGCDGVEPDNVDGYANDSGFDLTADDQLDFNRFLAGAAHERDLLVGLKNDLDQVLELVDHFDFAVSEQCHEYDECELLVPFVAAGKPVFDAEYDDAYVDDPDPVCAAASALGLRTQILPLDLDGSFRITCP